MHRIAFSKVRMSRGGSGVLGGGGVIENEL